MRLAACLPLASGLVGGFPRFWVPPGYLLTDERRWPSSSPLPSASSLNTELGRAREPVELNKRRGYSVLFFQIPRLQPLSSIVSSVAPIPAAALSWPSFSELRQPHSCLPAPRLASFSFNLLRVGVEGIGRTRRHVGGGYTHRQLVASPGVVRHRSRQRRRLGPGRAAVSIISPHAARDAF